MAPTSIYDCCIVKFLFELYTQKTHVPIKAVMSTMGTENDEQKSSCNCNRQQAAFGRIGCSKIITFFLDHL